MIAQNMSHDWPSNVVLDSKLPHASINITQRIQASWRQCTGHESEMCVLKGIKNTSN